MSIETCNEIKTNLASAQKALGLLRPEVDTYVDEKENRAENAKRVDKLRSEIKQCIVRTHLAMLLRFKNICAERGIKPFSLTIGGENKEDLLKKLWFEMGIEPRETVSGFYFSERGAEKLELIKVSVGDLGFTGPASLEEIYAQADMLGLDLCPPEVGVYQRLQDTNNAFNDSYAIAMKPIIDKYNHPRILFLQTRNQDRKLSTYLIDESFSVSPDYRFVFHLRTAQNS